MSAEGSATLSRLRRSVADIEGRRTSLEACARVPFGISAIDRALGGGLARGALHEVSPSRPFALGAAFGFAIALCARAGGAMLWIQQDFAGAQAGHAYGPGLDAFGLPSRRVLVLQVARAVEALWAMEEALKCRSLATIVTELADDTMADLTATRRLVLAAQEGRGLGVLFLHRASLAANAASTRWQVVASESGADAFGGLGPAAFDLSLVKNRQGPGGRWSVTWNQHERIFSPLSLAVAAPACDRPDRAPLLAAR